MSTRKFVPVVLRGSFVATNALPKRKLELEMILLPLLALVPGRVDAPREFYDFLSKRDSSFTYSTRQVNGDTTIDLTSQTWQGFPWKHTIIYRQPPNVDHKGVAILYITGDGPKDADYRDLALITAITKMPVATLFNIPNQPLWDLKEDDLIAHTFEKYFETKDPSWPLLFPMAKSALRAMDAVQAATKDTENPITRFVVTGASKRGWTTWFVGAAADPRVIGIAPMVIDNLNIAKQMPHQLESWGKYSEQIEEYTRRGLQAKLATPDGQKLGRMIDPYYYLDRIKVPTLIVTAANDPYWTVDAMSLYWNDLKMPHWASIIPNAGHDLGDKIQVVNTVGAFAASLAGEFEMPKLNFQLTDVISRPSASGFRELLLKAETSGAPVQSIRVLAAKSSTHDFRGSKWEPVAEMKMNPAAPSGGTIKFQLPRSENAALLAEVHYKAGSRTFTLSRPVQVISKI